MTIKLFSKWRWSAILNLRKLPFWSPERYMHVILHHLSKICINRPIWSRYIAKTIFNMASVRHLGLKNFDFFHKFTCLEWKFASACTIIDRNRIIHGYKAIFKMAAVRHLEFWKNCRLVMWPVLACDSSATFRISR